MPSIISNDGTKIAYDKKGSGPVMILVLGALNKRGSGKKLAEQLMSHFTVVSYDRRGRGDSTDTLPYKTEKEVEDLAALIEELGGSAYLYGQKSTKRKLPGWRSTNCPTMLMHKLKKLPRNTAKRLNTSSPTISEERQ
jgi:hypothetical protein